MRKRDFMAMADAVMADGSYGHRLINMRGWLEYILRNAFRQGQKYERRRAKAEVGNDRCRSG